MTAKSKKKNGIEGKTSTIELKRVNISGNFETKRVVIIKKIFKHKFDFNVTI